MRTRLLSTMLLSCLVAAGCAAAGSSPTEVQTSEPVSAPAQPTIPDVESATTFDPDVVPDDALITIRRRGGAGATLFFIALSVDGDVEYEGVNLVATTGKRSGTLPAEAFAQAWRELVSLDRDHRERLEQCTRVSSDGPNVYGITVESQGEQIHFFGELDRPCADNEAHQLLVARYHAVLDAAGARAWVGDEVQ